MRNINRNLVSYSIMLGVSMALIGLGGCGTTHQKTVVTEEQRTANVSGPTVVTEQTPKVAYNPAMDAMSNAGTRSTTYVTSGAVDTSTQMKSPDVILGPFSLFAQLFPRLFLE